MARLTDEKKLFRNMVRSEQLQDCRTLGKTTTGIGPVILTVMLSVACGVTQYRLLKMYPVLVTYINDQLGLRAPTHCTPCRGGELPEGSSLELSVSPFST